MQRRMSASTVYPRAMNCAHLALGRPRMQRSAAHTHRLQERWQHVPSRHGCHFDNQLEEARFHLRRCDGAGNGCELGRQTSGVDVVAAAFMHCAKSRVRCGGMMIGSTSTRTFGSACTIMQMNWATGFWNASKSSRSSPSGLATAAATASFHLRSCARRLRCVHTQARGGRGGREHPEENGRSQRMEDIQLTPAILNTVSAALRVWLSRRGARHLDGKGSELAHSLRLVAVHIDQHSTPRIAYGTRVDKRPPRAWRGDVTCRLNLVYTASDGSSASEVRVGPRAVCCGSPRARISLNSGNTASKFPVCIDQNRVSWDSGRAVSHSPR
jgi:hypothetical protein